jgi:16S rRNA (guanine527-N7)-methyltransferase
MTENIPQLPQFPDLWQTSLGWQPTTQQQAQFQTLYDLTLAANRQFNLTRITAPTEFWEKHLWDSLSGIQPWLTPAALPIADQPAFPSRSQAASCLSLIDIGSGAGFPGLPLAIVYPNWPITLLDATRKKVNFLQQVIGAMGLLNGQTWVDRAEQIGHHPSHREQYDLATIRAVAAAPVCAEYALPLLKVGGVAILYRGQWTAIEAAALSAAVAQLGGTIAATIKFTTPLSQSVRHCLYLRKEAPTPIEFPRPIGIPSQMPL